MVLNGGSGEWERGPLARSQASSAASACALVCALTLDTKPDRV